MIVGVGVDAVSIVRMKQVLDRTPGFSTRVFTDAERTYAASKGRPESSLAARFAAKEACRKAIGEILPWQDMEVVNDASGAPRMRVAGRPDLLIHLSLTHTDDLAVAMVVAERPR